MAGVLLGEGCLTSELRSSCESRRGRPGLSVANRPYGLCGRKATFEEESKKIRAQEGAVSKSRCTVSVDVKQHLKVFDDR